MAFALSCDTWDASARFSKLYAFYAVLSSLPPPYAAVSAALTTFSFRRLIVIMLLPLMMQLIIGAAVKAANRAADYAIPHVMQQLLSFSLPVKPNICVGYIFKGFLWFLLKLLYSLEFRLAYKLNL